MRFSFGPRGEIWKNLRNLCVGARCPKENYFWTK